jgi:hypothetical protein
MKEGAMGPGLGQLPEVPGVDGVPDQVLRLREFRARHPYVSVLLPGQAGVSQPTATWLEADPDPRIDGAAMTVPFDELRDLLNYLEARFDR